MPGGREVGRWISPPAPCAPVYRHRQSVFVPLTPEAHVCTHGKCGYAQDRGRSLGWGKAKAVVQLAAFFLMYLPLGLVPTPGVGVGWLLPPVWGPAGPHDRQGDSGHVGPAAGHPWTPYQCPCWPNSWWLTHEHKLRRAGKDPQIRVGALSGLPPPVISCVPSLLSAGV